jgi:hypothetical protein
MGAGETEDGRNPGGVAGKHDGARQLAESGGAVETVRDQILMAGEHGTFGKRRAQVAEE